MLPIIALFPGLFFFLLNSMGTLGLQWDKSISYICQVKYLENTNEGRTKVLKNNKVVFRPNYPKKLSAPNGYLQKVKLLLLWSSISFVSIIIHNFYELQSFDAIPLSVQNFK